MFSDIVKLIHRGLVYCFQIFPQEWNDNIYAMESYSAVLNIGFALNKSMCYSCFSRDLMDELHCIANYNFYRNISMKFTQFSWIILAHLNYLCVVKFVSSVFFLFLFLLFQKTSSQIHNSGNALDNIPAEDYDDDDDDFNLDSQILKSSVSRNVCFPLSLHLSPLI